jgi:hypothetical protein
MSYAPATSHASVWGQNRPHPGEPNDEHTLAWYDRLTSVDRPDSLARYAVLGTDAHWHVKKCMPPVVIIVAN